MLKCALCTLAKPLAKYYINVQHYRVKVIGSIDIRLCICYTVQFERFGPDKIKVTTARSKVKSRSYYDVVHLHPLTSVSQCLYQDILTLMIYEIQHRQVNTQPSPPAWQKDCPTAQPDTLCDNNTCTV